MLSSTKSLGGVSLLCVCLLASAGPEILAHGGGAGFTVNANYGGGGSPYGMLGNPYGMGSMGSYGGGYYQYPDPYGGNLKGQASVISAQGQFLMDNQQSFLILEKVRKAQLDNSRANFDDWLYRRSNTPTLEDERQRVQALAVRRSMNAPPAPEVWSGKALNDLLAQAQKFTPSEAPALSVDEDVLKRINVTSGRNGSNFGVFRNEGNLAWPDPLKELKAADPLRGQLDLLARTAVEAARKGPVDAGILKEMGSLSARLGEALVKQAADLPFGQYAEAKQYLAQLDDGIKALRQPDIGNFVSGKYQLRGTNVADVVKQMKENGLIFAPGSPGDEAAYQALHRALAAYDLAAVRK